MKFKGRWLILYSATALALLIIWKIYPRYSGFRSTNSIALEHTQNYSSNGSSRTNRSILIYPKTESRQLPLSDARSNTTPALMKIVELRKTSKSRPAFLLLDDSGIVTSQAVQAASLTPDQTKMIQDKTDKLMSELSADIKSMTKEEPRFSKSGEPAYRIEPFLNQSNESIESYLDSLTTVVGAEKAWLLAKAIPMEELAGGMGNFEVIFRILEPAQEVISGMTAAEAKDFYSVDFEYRDPTSGKVIMAGKSNWQKFNKNFLKILD